MLKVLFALSAFASLIVIAFGTPVILDNSDLEDEDFNETDIETINQVAFSPLQINAGSKEYTVIADFTVNWFEAELICSAYGLALASINSQAESDKLHQYLIDNGLNSKTFWTSGNLLAGPYRWFWMSNGTPQFYTNWEQGEPNSFGNEQCLEVYGWNGKWNDNNCYGHHYFVCENRCPLTSYDVPIYPQNI